MTGEYNWWATSTALGIEAGLANDEMMTNEWKV
jgi:hypothetical protein